MAIARPWKQKYDIKDEQHSEFLVKSNVGIIRKVIAIIFTSAMWIYSISVFYTLLSGVMNHTSDFTSIMKLVLKITNHDIQLFFMWLVLGSILIFLIIWLWKMYNAKRYGPLTRRKHPLPTTDEDMLALELMSEADLKKLKSQKIVVFEFNPVKDLK